MTESTPAAMAWRNGGSSMESRWAINIHAGHPEMRIGRRIAVPRKCLAVSDSAFMRALDIGATSRRPLGSFRTSGC